DMTHRCVEHMFYLVALVTVVVVEGASSFINSSSHQFHVATILRGADNPTDVFIDHATNSILFVSLNLHYVGKLELPARCSAAASSNSTVTVIAGSRGQPPGFQDGEGSAALFLSPFSITGDGTTYYVGDSGNHRIR
ncbi:membrane-associated protein, putative, partial [Bodo saltans]